MKRLITILLAINMLLSICLSADMGAQLGIDRTALTANAAVDTSFYSVGDTISFGHYEQDCNTSNGAESIEWTVIDKTDSTLLLISKHALLDRQYNIDYVASNPDLWRCTWETCKLRAFLNSDFYFSAFSTDERSHIRLNYLSNPGNPDYGTKGGNDTSDYVYILSQEELNTYMPNASSRKAFPTKSAAAVKPGALKLEIASDGSCHWWLRTPGKHAGNAQYVRHGNGHLVSDGSDVGHVLGVRPVICIQAEAIKQTESVTLSADTLTVKGTEAVSLTATITPANSGSPTRSPRRKMLFSYCSMLPPQMQLYGTMYGPGMADRTKNPARSLRAGKLCSVQLDPFLHHRADGWGEILGDFLDGKEAQLFNLLRLGLQLAGEAAAEENDVNVADLVTVGIDIVQLRTGEDTE